MDFSYLDKRMQNIDRHITPEYTVKARIMKDGRLYGYRVEYSAIDWMDNQHTLDLTRPQFESYAANKYLRNVKMTSNGPTGYNGFELRSLPTIELAHDFVVVCGLKVFNEAPCIGYIVMNSQNSPKQLGSNWVNAGDIAVISSEEIWRYEKELYCDGIQAVAKANTGNGVLGAPVLSSEQSQFCKGNIVVVAQASDGIFYLREPYINTELKKIIRVYFGSFGGKVYTDIRSDATIVLSYQDTKRYEEYLHQLLVKDIETMGQVGADGEDAKRVAIPNNEYLSRWKTPEPQTRIEYNVPEDNAMARYKSKNKPQKKGLRGLFDMFSR